MTENNELTNKTLERLRGLAKGNGLKPEAIKLVRQEEAIYKLQGQLNLRPSFTVESKTQPGRPGKGEILPSFVALQEAVANERKSFEQGGTWLKDALNELEKEPSHGWGIELGELKWKDQTKILAACEACPACEGRKQMPCTFCQQQGYVPCEYCHGTTQEQCPHCFGSGCEGGNQNVPCHLCQGRLFIDCRYCQRSGQMLCPHCLGKKGTPCTSCKATGAISQFAKIKESAEISFTLGKTTDLPSGLLRMMERIGEENLGKGHMDVAMTPPPAEPETPEEKTRVLLEASIPFAKMTIAFGSQEEVVYAFGKMGRLSNVPAFLDQSLRESRKDLALAAQGKGELNKTMTKRLMLEALALILTGMTKATDLRRRYPVGLSQEAADEIMRHMAAALRKQTSKTRLVLIPLTTLPALGLFAAYFFIPSIGSAKETLMPFTRIFINVLIPIIGLGLTYSSTLFANKWALTRNFPKAKIAATQPIGKIGYVTLLCVIIAYLITMLIFT